MIVEVYLFIFQLVIHLKRISLFLMERVSDMASMQRPFMLNIIFEKLMKFKLAI